MNEKIIFWINVSLIFYPYLHLININNIDLFVSGYGHIAPVTPVGKLVTIFYAIIGMPLFLLYLSNIGDIMATRWPANLEQVIGTCLKKIDRFTSEKNLSNL